MANWQSSYSLQGRNPGMAILKEILKKIKLDESLIKENNHLLREFLMSFTQKMKEVDEVFNAVYQRPYYTGSFYSDLRVSTPDEFDILLILKLPFADNDFDIEYHPQVPSFATCRLKNKERASLNHPRLYRQLFEDGYMICENVREWIQSVVDKAVRSYNPPCGISSVSLSSSGPARTIQLRKSNGYGIIDIDLVPVFGCVFKTRLLDVDHRARNKLDSRLQAYVVPKPYASVAQPPVNSHVSRQLFRIHFPDAEDELIHNIGCVKPVIKLLKLLRDEENWKILASYYLKTVVMLMLLENSTQEYWKEDNMDDRFIDALKKLAECLEVRKIPFFFSKKNNLISKITPYEASNIHNRLHIIIRNVQNDPKNFWKYFNVSRTF